MSQVPGEFQGKKANQYHFYPRGITIIHLFSSEFEATLIECVRPCAQGQIKLGKIKAANLQIGSKEYLIIRKDNN